MCGLHACMLITSVVSNSWDPPDGSHQAPLSIGFSRKAYWSGFTCPPPDLPNPGIKTRSLLSPALAGGFFTSVTWEAPKMKVLVVQSCLTLYDPMDCRPPGSSIHEILQAGIQEWVAIPFSRGSSCPGIKPALQADSLTSEPPCKPICDLYDHKWFWTFKVT